MIMGFETSTSGRREQRARPRTASPTPGPAAALRALLAGLAASHLTFATAVAASDVSRVRELVAQLAHPSLDGRAPGSDGLETARRIVVSAMESAGLQPGAGADTEAAASADPDGPRPGDVDFDADAAWLQRFGTADLPVGVAVRPEEVHLPAKVTWESVGLANVIGILPGNGPGPRECVVVGAHLDHLGTAPDGTVFAGADDNASGVVAMIEAARTLVAEGPYPRDIVFVAFDGEEAGLLGARYFVAHPTHAPTAVQAMVNLDTVGRLDGRSLLALGSGSGAGLTETLQGMNLGYGFDLGLPATGPFASDQVAFFEAGIPVVHFTTGPNPDYHRAGDTPDKTAADGIVEIAAFAAELVAHLADGDRLAFVPPGAAEAEKMAAPAGPPRRVSLGTIPDFARESGGVLLSGVMPGSPAEGAGLRAGDILVEMDGTPVDNLGDFTGILKAHAPGDEVEVVVVRGVETIRARVTLIERK